MHDRHPCTAFLSDRSEVAPNRDPDEQGSEKDRRDLASAGCGHERRRVADRDGHTVDAGASSATGIGENAVDERAAVEIDQRVGEGSGEPSEARQGQEHAGPALGSSRPGNEAARDERPADRKIGKPVPRVSPAERDPLGRDPDRDGRGPEPVSETRH